MRNHRLRDTDGTEYDPETGQRVGALPPYPAEAMREMIEDYEQMVREVTGISLEREDDDA